MLSSVQLYKGTEVVVGQGVIYCNLHSPTHISLHGLEALFREHLSEAIKEGLQNRQAEYQKRAVNNLGPIYGLPTSPFHPATS